MKRSRRASAVPATWLALVRFYRSPEVPRRSRPVSARHLQAQRHLPASPANFARANAPAALVSIALKKPRTRASTSESWPANSIAVATSRHPRRPLAPLVAVDVAGKQGPQAIDRSVARTEFDIYPRQSVGDVAIERTQEERVLASEGGIKAATRKLRRSKQVGKRRAVIAARPKHAHGTLDSGFRVETTGPATPQLHWGLVRHSVYLDQSVLNCKGRQGRRFGSADPARQRVLPDCF